MIRELFVVTETSVYHVKDGGENGHPSAIKVTLKRKSKLPIGYVLRGAAIIIGNCLYVESAEDGHGGHSSSIVALFKNEEEAFRCLENDGLKPHDPRWTKQTREVLDEIGDDHPAFKVCRLPGFSLTPEAQTHEKTVHS